MKLISSRDNPLFKNIKSLAQSSRERRKTGLALLEGIHLVSSFIAVHGSPRTIAVSESGQQQSEIMNLLAACAASETVVLSDALFKEASTLETPTGILALIEPPPQQHVPRGISSCVLLEDIQDPGNVGSILRSAAAAGVPHVLMSGNCAFAWSPKVLRAGLPSRA